MRRASSGSGKLEFGQTSQENVLREVLEEYGCFGEIQEQLPAHSVLREWNNVRTHWVAIPFFIKIKPEEVDNKEPERIDQLGWFTLLTLPDNLHTGFQFQISHYEEYFDKYKM